MTRGWDRGELGERPPQMKHKTHECAQAECGCSRCDTSLPAEEFRCKVCHEVLPFEKANIYRRTTSLPFGVKSACCGWHNFQPRCKWCDRKYLSARGAVDKVRAILRGYGLKETRLLVQTYLKTVTIDTSHLGAQMEHKVLAAFTTTFSGAKERPVLLVRTGDGIRKIG